MSDKVRKDLEKFLRQQIFARRRETPLQHFVLRSAGSGSKGTEVDTIELPLEMSVEHVGMFADDVLSRAQTDADSLGSKLQRYVLMACEQGARSGPRFPFRLRGDGDEDEEGEGEDAPTEKGLTSQLMRHNEALMRMLVMTTGTQVTAMSRRLEAQEKQMERIYEERSKDREVLEQAKSDQHDRDMQLMLTSGQEERKSELFKKLESLIPVIVNKVTGKPILPEGPGGDVVKSLANSFTSDQLVQIGQFLSQEQQILLMTLLKAARDPEPAKNGVAS